MGSKGDRKEPAKEPFLLSILPFAGLGLLLVLALAWRLLGRNDPSPPPTVIEAPESTVIERWGRSEEVDIPVSASDFSLGPEDAPVTLVEFSDFECPFCRAGAEAVKNILERFPGQVRVVFKNLPLDTSCNPGLAQQLHPLACRAAVLARCAGAKDPDRFWAAHDALFRAPRLNQNVLSAIPSELSIPSEEIEACLLSPEPLDKVKEDVALARKLRLSATPSFFLNGRRVSNYSGGALGQLVQHVLAEEGS